MEKKTEKRGLNAKKKNSSRIFLLQDFAQTQENFARSHNRVTGTFRKSSVEGMSIDAEGQYSSCRENRL